MVFFTFRLDKLVELLGILSGYSITVKELKTLLATLKGVNGKWVSWKEKFMSDWPHSG